MERWVRGFNIEKMSILPKCIYTFNKISIKIPAGFLVDIDKLILILTWECKEYRIAKTSLQKEQS